jgi:hypothetical protein
MAENQAQAQTGGKRSALDPTGGHDQQALADTARRFGAAQVVGKEVEDPEGDHSEAALEEAGKKFGTED